MGLDLVLLRVIVHELLVVLLSSMLIRKPLLMFVSPEMCQVCIILWHSSANTPILNICIFAARSLDPADKIRGVTLIGVFFISKVEQKLLYLQFPSVFRAVKAAWRNPSCLGVFHPRHTGYTATQVQGSIIARICVHLSCSSLGQSVHCSTYKK